MKRKSWKHQERNDSACYAVWGILNKIKSWFLIINHGAQKTGKYHLKFWQKKKQKLSTKNSLSSKTILQKWRWGLPWWCSGWESACQCRGHGFEPWSGKIPHAAKQLGPWATTTEPVRLEPVFCNKRGCDSERPMHRDEEWPPLAATRESPHTETKTQRSQK